MLNELHSQALIFMYHYWTKLYKELHKNGGTLKG